MLLVYFCSMKHRPEIAILDTNTLSAMGLASIIEQAMPIAMVRTFSSFKELQAADSGQFFHYFVAAGILMQHARYFVERARKTLVLLEGDHSNHLPAHFHTINVTQSKEDFLRSFMRLHASAHGENGSRPCAAHATKEAHGMLRLTPRETEVLRLMVKGKTSKEIAANLGIGLTTVISHRKNLTMKLGTRSISALTVFAVSHGLIKIEDI